MEQQLDAVLAQLAFRDRFRRGSLHFGRRTGALVLQIEGASGEAERWFEGFRGRCEEVLPIGSPGAVREQAPDERQVVEQLQAITETCGYEGRPPYALPIVFPRFAAARTALYDWQPADGDSDRQQSDSLLRAVKDAITRAKSLTLQEARDRAAQISQDENVAQQLNGFVGVVLRVTSAVRRPYGRTMRWFRTVRFQNLATDARLCKELRGWRGKTAEDKHLLLVEALLADVDAHYGVFRRLNRTGRPVFFLPDVDTHPARRAIRDRLLEAYDGNARALRVYPVVVTTAQPDAAPPARGAKPAVEPADLVSAIPARFRDRARVADERSRGEGEPLPSRLVQVTLGTVPQPAPDAARTGEPRRSSRTVGPLTAGTMALALVAVSTLAYVFLHEPDGPPGCGQGLEVHGQDCVGVSDGTGVFMPAVPGMREVSARIAEQNGAVAGRAHATVALLIPLEADSPAVRRQILSEVQGAYLAQARANSEDAAKPLIRLVLANPGRDYRLWRHTVDQLVAREPNLRVIAGFNLSLRDTRDALSHVTNTLKIPAVASLVTAGDFANPEAQDKVPFPGLARVASTSEDQARALLQFDPDLATSETALVADYRPGDNYNRSLRQAFTEARDDDGKNTAVAAGVQDMRFESPGLEEAGVTANEFEDFAGNICRSNARVVYFAGRAFHLEMFVKKLAGSYCRDKKSYTVITGSDATTLEQRLDDRERELLRGDPGAGKPAVAVRYAAPAHPEAWQAEIRDWQKQADRDGAHPPRYLSEPREAMDTLQQDIAGQAGAMGEVNLADGRTIVTHDVVLTASRALARAVHIGKQEVPSTDRVRRDLSKLNSELRIQGASGWICLTNAGNPYNKALAVVRLEPGSERLTFEGIAWPSGHAPQNDCVIPANL